MSQQHALDADAIDQAFYTMKGLEKVAQAIPPMSREGISAELAVLFKLTPPAKNDESSLKTFLMFCRMKLDALPEQAAARTGFTRAVMAVMPAPAGSGAGPDQSSQAGIEAEQEPVRHIQGEAPASRQPDPEPRAQPAKVATSVSATVHGPVALYETQEEPEDPPAGFARLLLPPPSRNQSRQIGLWLSGDAWNDSGVTIAFRQTDHFANMVTEVEAEIDASPASCFDEMGLRTHAPHDPLLENLCQGRPGDWLIGQGEGEVETRYLQRFGRAMGAAIYLLDPERAAMLARCGAGLAIGAKGKELISAAGRIEDLFCEELADVDHRPEQSLNGNITPYGKLEPGQAFVRAAFMVAIGHDLGEALVDGLLDFRTAQALRAAIERDEDQEDLNEIHAMMPEVFFTDCRTPLLSCSVAKNEYEPAL